MNYLNQKHEIIYHLLLSHVPALDSTGLRADNQGEEMKLSNTKDIPWPTIGDVYERRTDYWRIRRTVTGINGLGCPWLKEEWIWPTGGTCRTETLTISPDETVAMLANFAKL